MNHGPMTIGYLLEIPVFLAVGFLIGLMVDRQEHYRRGLEVQAETLDGRFCSKSKCKVFEQIVCAN